MLYPCIGEVCAKTQKCDKDHPAWCFPLASFLLSPLTLARRSVADLNKFIPPARTRGTGRRATSFAELQQVREEEECGAGLRTLAGLRGWEEYGRLSLVVAGGGTPGTLRTGVPVRGEGARGVEG